MGQHSASAFSLGVISCKACSGCEYSARCGADSGLADLVSMPKLQKAFAVGWVHG